MTTLMPSPVESGVRFALREYQQDALDRIARAEQRGVTKLLGVAATGLGKTVIFCSLAAQRGGRTLILVHRDELVRQAVTKVSEIWPDVHVGIVKAEQNDVGAHVIVASVQTLARQRRLDQLLTAPDSLLGRPAPFDLVVVDEAHHVEADTYQRILDQLSAVQRVEYGPDTMPLLLGVTATPDRGDGKGLDTTFDEIVWNYDLLWGIRAGYLADVRAKKIVIDRLDMSRVKVRHGDYDAGSAGRALAAADAPVSIVKAWHTHASSRQTLVFTPTVELAQDVADEFRRTGVRAAMVSGATPQDERRALLHDYAIGNLQVVANCAVLTEGYDDPRTDCIVVARPTKSRALFTQMIGRGTRKHPDKDHLLVLDVVGNSDRLSLVTVPSLFGIEDETAAREIGERNLTDIADEIDQAKLIAGRLRAEEADLFRKLHELRAKGIAWLKCPDKAGRPRFERQLSYRRRDGQWEWIPTVVLVQNNRDDENSWMVGLVPPQGHGKQRVLLADVSLELAQSVGEDYCMKHGRGYFVNANAEWRKKPPSPKMRAAAKKWGIDVAGKTGGEVSDAIGVAIATKRNLRGNHG